MTFEISITNRPEVVLFWAESSYSDVFPLLRVLIYVFLPSYLLSFILSIHPSVHLFFHLSVIQSAILFLSLCASVVCLMLLLLDLEANTLVMSLTLSSVDGILANEAAGDYDDDHHLLSWWHDLAFSNADSFNHQHSNDERLRISWRQFVISVL